jgi:uncharacterized membrane protein YdfJ with MMPL/SSD domain
MQALDRWKQVTLALVLILLFPAVLAVTLALILAGVGLVTLAGYLTAHLVGAGIGFLISMAYGLFILFLRVREYWQVVLRYLCPAEGMPLEEEREEEMARELYEETEL